MWAQFCEIITCIDEELVYVKNVLSEGEVKGNNTFWYINNILFADINGRR